MKCVPVISLCVTCVHGRFLKSGHISYVDMCLIFNITEILR